MKRADLKVGKVYVVAGRGEMRMAEFCDPPEAMMRQFRAYGGVGAVPQGTTVRLEGHGGGNYWAAPEDIVREASRADLDAREAQARFRGVACDDPECWCLEYGLVKCRHCGHLTDPSDCGKCGSIP